MSDTRTKLGRKILELQKDSGARLVYGVAASTTTVYLDGSTTAVTAPRLGSVGAIAAGDYLAVLKSGADALIVGRVGTGERSCALSVSTTLAVPNNTNTTVVYNTGMLNVGWRNGSNNGIVIPRAGVYQVTSTLNYEAMVAGSRVRNTINLNGTAQSSVDEVAIGSAGASSSVAVTCAANDVVAVVAFQNSGVTQNLDAKTRLTVTRLD